MHEGNPVLYIQIRGQWCIHGSSIQGFPFKKIFRGHCDPQVVDFGGHFQFERVTYCSLTGYTGSINPNLLKMGYSVKCLRTDDISFCHFLNTTSRISRASHHKTPLVLMFS